MTRTWVVGVDGSDGARTALEWAVAQAVGRDVGIHALGAWHVPSVALGGTAAVGMVVDWSDLGDAERARLEAEVAAATRPGVAVEPIVVQGGASSSLIEASKGADLLVVGSRGRGGFARLALGSTGLQCATHAACATVVVPCRTPASAVRRVVVGVDGSPNSAAALTWALRFADEIGSPTDGGVGVEVVGACEVSPWTDPATTRRRFATEVDAHERDFEAFVALHDPTGRAVHRHVLHGARQALVEAAAGADLVVLGARGRGAIGAALLGSVSTWFLHNSPVPTVVVPDRRPG